MKLQYKNTIFVYIYFPYPCLSGIRHSSFLPSVHHSTLRHGTDWRIFPRQWTAPCCGCSRRSPAGRWLARPLPSWWSSTESRQSSATSPPFSAKYINLVRFVAISVGMKSNLNYILIPLPIPVATNKSAKPALQHQRFYKIHSFLRSDFKKWYTKGQKSFTPTSKWIKIRKSDFQLRGNRFY